jgi:Fibronectin type III domain
VDLEWVADNSTGFAKTFKVHVTFENSIYEMVEGCDLVQKKKMSFEATESRLHLTNLEPYSQYSVKIESQSEYGISDPSRKHSFTTKLSEPSPPRDVYIDFSPDDFNQSLIVGTVNWSPPCHPNGRIEFYTIKLNGRRGSSSDIARTEVSFETNFSFIDLRRGFKYEFEVKAKNAEFYGEATKFSFKTPSGGKFEVKLNINFNVK